jgi:hypothetical protein
MHNPVRISLAVLSNTEGLARMTQEVHSSARKRTLAEDQDILDESRKRLGSLSSLRGRTLSSHTYYRDDTSDIEEHAFKVPKVLVQSDHPTWEDTPDREGHTFRIPKVPVQTGHPPGLRDPPVPSTPRSQELTLLRRQVENLEVKLLQLTQPTASTGDAVMPQTKAVSKERLTSLMESLVSGHTTSEDKEFAQSFLSQGLEDKPDSPELKAKVDFSTQQLDSIKAAINGGILELRKLLKVHWGELEEPASRATRYLESLMEDSETTTTKEESAGLPVPKDFGDHLSALWRLKSPANAKLHTAFRLAPKPYKKYAMFTKTPDTTDLDQLGISKESCDKIKARVNQLPISAMAAEAGTTASQAVKLDGVVGSSLEAIKMFQNTAIQASTAAKTALKDMRSAISKNLDRVAVRDMNFKDLKEQL